MVYVIAGGTGMRLRYAASNRLDMEKPQKRERLAPFFGGSAHPRRSFKYSVLLDSSGARPWP